MEVSPPFPKERGKSAEVAAKVDVWVWVCERWSGDWGLARDAA